MDYKSRASGEEQQQTSERRPVTKLILSSGPNLELAMEVISHLEVKFRTNLSVTEKEQWTKELSHVSDQKLLRAANEFNGPFIGNIWKFLEEIQVVPETHHAPKQLPEPMGKRGVRCAQAYRDLESGRMSYVQYLERIQQIAKECE